MLDFTQRYVKAPALFVEEVLGVKPLPYQAEFLDAIASGERKFRSDRVMALVRVQQHLGRCYGIF